MLGQYQPCNLLNLAVNHYVLSAVSVLNLPVWNGVMLLELFLLKLTCSSCPVVFRPGCRTQSAEPTSRTPAAQRAVQEFM